MSIADWPKPFGGLTVSWVSRPCSIVELSWCLFVNIASLHSRSIKRCQWKNKLDYCGVVFAHLATRYGIKVKDPSGWIQIGESHTRGVARIPLKLKPSRDCRATSQQDSPTWIQPEGSFAINMSSCCFIRSRRARKKCTHTKTLVWFFPHDSNELTQQEDMFYYMTRC